MGLNLVVGAFFSLALQAQEKTLPTVAIFFNPTTNSTSTSNRVDGQLKAGLTEGLREAGLKRLRVEWINSSESADDTLIAYDKVKALKPSLIIGPSLSSQVLILLNLLKKDGLSTPLITAAGTSTEILKYDNAFMLSNSNSVQAKMLVTEIRNQKPRKVAVVKIRDCVYCANIADEMVAELKASDVKTFEISVLEDKIESDEGLARSFDADHIVVPGLELNTAKVIHRVFPFNSHAQYWSADGVGTLARFVRDLGLSQLKFSWLAHYTHTISNPENRAFVKGFKKTYSMEPVDTAAFSYEAVKIGAELFINKTKTESFKSLTGRAIIKNNFVVRPMPLMRLTPKGTEMVRMIEVAK